MDPTTIIYTVGTFGMLFGIPPALSSAGDDAGLNFDYLVVIPGVAALMYLLMTFDIGSATFQGYHVPFPRYIDWLLTTPFLIGYTAYIAGASRRSIWALALVDALMIGLGVAAIVLTPPGQWIAFGLSAFCHLILIVGLYGPVRRSAREQSSGTRRRLGRLLLNYIGLLWITYPIVWAFGPGTGLVESTGLAVIITYMDVTAKVPFVYFIHRAQEKLGSPENTTSESISSSQGPALSSTT